MPEIPFDRMTSHQLLVHIAQNQENLMPEITELIAGLRTAIADEVAEAITGAQARIDEAVADATTAEEARAAAQGELDRLKDEVRTVTEDVRAPGLIGQDGNQPEEEPADPEVLGEDPEQPIDPENPGENPTEPTDPESPAEEPEQPGNPGEVVF